VAIDTLCSVCESGKYRDTDALLLDLCQSCKKNTYLPDPGIDRNSHIKISQCVSCYIGTFSRSGSAGCIACPAGKRSLQIKNETDCLSCPVSNSVSI
jgi:hypothetical protein